MSHRAKPEALRKAIAAAYKADVPTKIIAERYKVSIAYVSVCARRAGVPLRAPKRNAVLVNTRAMLKGK